MPARYFRAQLLAKQIDRDESLALAHMPEHPAIAGFRSLHMGADLVDRARGVAAGDRAIGAHSCRDAIGGVVERVAGFDKAALDKRAERNARLGALACRNLQRFGRKRLDGRDARRRAASA